MSANFALSEVQLTQLYMQHHKQLVMRAAYIVGDIYAEEVVQETWLTLMCGKTDFSKLNSTRSWLFKVVINKSINRKKRELRKESLSNLYDSSGTRYEHEIIDFQTNPESLLRSEECLDLINQAWSLLSENQKRATYLRFVANLSYEEVAETLGLSITNCKVIVHRAKSRLYEALVY